MEGEESHYSNGNSGTDGDDTTHCFFLTCAVSKYALFHLYTPPSSTMDSLGAIEAEYIKNLQKQVCLLECETSYLYPLKYCNTVLVEVAMKTLNCLHTLSPQTVFRKLENCESQFFLFWKTVIHWFYLYISKPFWFFYLFKNICMFLYLENMCHIFY